jgi:hypothetical protein
MRGKKIKLNYHPKEGTLETSQALILDGEESQY